MAWRIEYAPRANKLLRGLDTKTSGRILAALESIASLDDPRQRGHGLVGKFSGMWRYRVGDWRIIARIEHSRLVIVVVTLGNRREIYDD